VSATFISPTTLDIANRLISWAETSLVADHPELNRPGDGSQAVCPFVRKSLDSSRFYMSFHPEVNGQSYEQVEAVVNSYIDPFKLMPPFQPELLTTKSLLVVFPELPEREAFLLDAVQDRLKSRFVENGLMLAQFHSRCDERSIHTRGLKLYASPFPLMSIRHMAIHDILFLENKPEWFKSYNVLFGDRFKPGGQLEPHNKHLVALYQRAKDAAS